MYKKENNYAFIDGQNLYISTTKSIVPWKINLSKFRIYLKQKLGVSRAYYFLGFYQKPNQRLYKEIQKAGFILIFKEHTHTMLGTKKGNVDSDIIFFVMLQIYKKEDFESVVIVSGDGDYKKLVDFLIEEHKFRMLLFPNRQYASSLYKKIQSNNVTYLDDPDIKKKIS